MSYYSNLHKEQLRTARTLTLLHLNQTMFQGQIKAGMIFFSSLSNRVLEQIFVWRDINDRQGSCRSTELEGINPDPSLCMKILRGKKNS